jgi:malate synthase
MDFAGGAGRISTVFPEPVLDLVGELHRRFSPARLLLLSDRDRRQAEYDSGGLPGYLPAEFGPVMPRDWGVAPLPPDLLTRRVEITGPVNDSKMVINMLSRSKEGARADAAMLDFEDSMKPTWRNVLAGLENVRGAARGTLRLTANGKEYALDPSDMPLFMVRVRGLHLDEWNVTVDGTPVSAGLVDLVASAYHSASALVEAGRLCTTCPSVNTTWRLAGGTGSSPPSSRGWDSRGARFVSRSSSRRCPPPSKWKRSSSSSVREPLP